MAKREADPTIPEAKKRKLFPSYAPTPVASPVKPGGQVLQDLPTDEPIFTFWMNHEVIAQLGEGGFGKVLAVRNIYNNQEYAIKLIYKSTPQTQIEADALTELSEKCPSIIKFYGLYKIPDPPPYFHTLLIRDALFMERVHGESLDNIKLSPNGAIWLLKSLCEQLGCAHSMGIVHRDIKPSNIMIETDSRSAKLVDFGIVCMEKGITGTKKPKTKTTKTVKKTIPICDSKFAGTIPYLAPELIDQYLFDHTRFITPSSATDIWSLGSSIYKSLTGNYIYPTRKKIPLRPDVIYKSIEDIQNKHFLPDDHILLENIIKRMIDYYPKNRPSASQICKLLAD